MTASSGAQGDGEDERKATEQEEGGDLTDGVVESEGRQRAPGSLYLKVYKIKRKRYNMEKYKNTK